MIERPVFHGIATHLRQTGRPDGLPVLAVHGFAADQSVWMLVEPALQAECALTLLDLPAHGGSAPVLPDGGLDGFGAHLAAVLDGLGPHWLLAHSFGAAVALRAASLRPDRVAGLILIAPAGLGAGVAPDFVRDLCAAPDAASMRASLGRMLTRPAMITPAMAQGVLAQMQDTERGAALRGVAALLPDLGAALAPHLPALAPLPIQILHGAQDAIIAPDTPLPACWPHAQRHLIASAGHLPQLETAPATIALIRAALGLT
jgi:pyruvate dehydrogenase E2 component (dihydrolipoamide acetyltransferase)